MNKIVLHTGLLVFFIAVIFFGQKGMAIEDIILRSLVIFVSFTIMISLIALIFVRSINKTAITRRKNLTDNLEGNKL